MTYRRVMAMERLSERGNDRVYLTLECGHVQSIGGTMDRRPDDWDCKQSPCYRPERYMGND